MHPACMISKPFAPYCVTVTKPVDVVMGMSGATFGFEGFEDAGVKRISVGSALSRAAFGALVRAAKEIKARGTFTFSSQAIGFSEMEEYFEGNK